MKNTHVAQMKGFRKLSEPCIIFSAPLGFGIRNEFPPKGCHGLAILVITLSYYILYYCAATEIQTEESCQLRSCQRRLCFSFRICSCIIVDRTNLHFFINYL